MNSLVDSLACSMMLLRVPRFRSFRWNRTVTIPVLSGWRGDSSDENLWNGPGKIRLGSTLELHRWKYRRVFGAASALFSIKLRALGEIPRSFPHASPPR